jgi:hypothetical protein
MLKRDMDLVIMKLKMKTTFFQINLKCFFLRFRYGCSHSTASQVHNFKLSFKNIESTAVKSI